VYLPSYTSGCAKGRSSPVLKDRFTAGPTQLGVIGITDTARAASRDQHLLQSPIPLTQLLPCLLLPMACIATHHFLGQLLHLGSDVLRGTALLVQLHQPAAQHSTAQHSRLRDTRRQGLATVHTAMCSLGTQERRVQALTGALEPHFQTASQVQCRPQYRNGHSLDSHGLRCRPSCFALASHLLLSSLM